ncbi:MULTISPECIES: alcohol dehydrogenase [Mammaliicoccus]|uniref:Alcohol dehydrogenase n=1 Tax=Mammaliicoccus lentus TaxID=42858 RepID=A0AAX3W5I0_MAMLE|nr:MULTISPECIES: alcohol dehydrogenase [Mammaliicoccus]HBV03272.1 alcohol dehydrogenase [Staphylococcus sp.]MBW0768711.1 alcohol dehydrogenase [Mammaliicoccus lentus]MEB8091508.1 alcohol dehydrogenase [Mammaliicoccus lentus]POA04338.1 alcohol dehydrogenase [Mammaliicoccus lentus]WHI60642.1 alcohol dehydrogenase [Mammaliicoccus lentus]
MSIKDMFKKIKPKEQECCSVEFEEKNDSKDNKEDNNDQSNE